MIRERQHNPETEWNEEYREMRQVSPKKGRSRQTGSLLLIIQLTACGIVLAAALVLRLLGGETLELVKNWYWEHLNSSIVAQEKWDEVETRFWDLIPSEEENSTVSSQTETSSSLEE